MSLAILVDMNLSVEWVPYLQLRQYEPELVAGALVVVDVARSRVRVLPL